MAELEAKPGFDPMKTQKLERNDGDRTQKVRALDPDYRPDVTQKIDATKMEETQILDAKKMETTAILDGNPSNDAEVTQRLTDSIWRLQEARRILQKLPKS